MQNINARKTYELINIAILSIKEKLYTGDEKFLLIFTT
jgi:hypothetical protein